MTVESPVEVGAFGPLVTVPWLQAHLEDPELVLFDCRFTLADPEAGRRQYLEGHLPGALFLDLERDLSGPAGAQGGRHPLPDPAVLAAKLGRWGVDQDATVVVYDHGTDGMAPRAWWLLGYLGLARVAVLDGGLPAWLAAGGRLSAGTADEERPRPKRTFTPKLRHDWIRTAAEVRRLVADQPGGVVLVDSRAPERYRGDVEPLDPVAGHIPGAVNAYWAQVLTSDGRWKSPEELARHFQGLADAQEVVVYCGSGVSACVNLLAMHLAGLKQARLYPGSWSDWCTRPGFPLATGPHPHED